MRMIRVLSALVLLGAAWPAHAQGEREFFRVVQLGRKHVLSIRERPDAAAPLIGDIPWNGRRIRGSGCTSDTPSGRTWCRVKYRGVVGWTRRYYLRPE